MLDENSKFQRQQTRQYRFECSTYYKINYIADSLTIGYDTKFIMTRPRIYNRYMDKVPL
jgi:hypothetical protein